MQSQVSMDSEVDMPVNVGPSSSAREMSSPPATSRVEVLIRQLVKHVAHGIRAVSVSQASGIGRDVILDFEVDGVRCLLVRRQPKSFHAVILSPREDEIARMVAKGYPNKAIAIVLNISPWTVSTHLRRLFAKLGVSSRAAMVARLLEEGLIADGPEHFPVARETDRGTENNGTRPTYADHESTKSLLA